MDAADTYATEMAVLYRLMNAEVKTWPFPHFYVPDIFPPALYPRLIDQLPENGAYTPMDEYGTTRRGGYKERMILSLGEDNPGVPPLWREVGEWMLGSRFAKAMLNKFRPFITRQWGDALTTKRLTKDARLVRDFTNYALPPHTDMPEKVLAFLFYLPNSLFGFIRTDNAFHGVEPVTDTGVQRDLLLYNLYLVD